MTITDQEIYNNRLKWIEYLKRPETKKFTGALESGHDPECRCCLGHACHVLAPETRTDGFVHAYYDSLTSELPEHLVEILGMHNSDGGKLRFGNLQDLKVVSLAALNDYTPATPPEIGAYLESVIMGGDDTPFEKIDVELPK